MIQIESVVEIEVDYRNLRGFCYCGIFFGGFFSQILLFFKVLESDGPQATVHRLLRGEIHDSYMCFLDYKRRGCSRNVHGDISSLT